MSAHTPGPWRIRACGCCCEDVNCAVVASRPDNLDVIAQICREHNAHDELVAALQRLVNVGLRGWTLKDMECARAALAKAGAA